MLLKELNIQPQVYFSAPFKRIADSFERLIDECYIPNNPIVPTLFVSILTQLFEKYYSNSVSNSARIKKAINYIAENYNKPLDTSYCAELCRMSQSHFLHIFKSVMGMSPHAYQTQKRISHAKFLLKYNSLSIEKISNEIGIANQFYFSKVFKREIGCSPYDFRKNTAKPPKRKTPIPNNISAPLAFAQAARSYTRYRITKQHNHAKRRSAEVCMASVNRLFYCSIVYLSKPGLNA